MAGMQINIYVSVAIPWIAALIALSMRIWARRLTKMSWWVDDYACVGAFIFATGYSGIMIEWTRHTYLGVIIPDTMPIDQKEAILEQSRFLSYFNSLCYAASIACCKIAILCLYWRLFKTSSIRIPILVLLVIVTIWILIRTFMLTFRCVPVQSLWDYSITDKVCNIDSGKFFMGTITTHFLLDIIILILPLIEVFRLRMRLGQKLAVAALFLIGLVVCMASAFVLYEMVRPPLPGGGPGQEPYEYAMFCVWGSVEVNIAIVSACFPLLRPIATKLFPKGIFSSYARKTSYGISGQGYHLSGNSYPQSRSRTGKVSTIVRSMAVKDDDTSSTHQLADLHPGGSFDSDQGKNGEGVHTRITGPASSVQSDPEHTAGILVHNDTVIQIEYDARKEQSRAAF
ncbi:hypothetical protein NLU13_9561 [Sarocladium strictum]|uniref:Rhodopsin domain-containing protein n=1 Tax=Sarocladium strictum TaxID=5046 RepID=A0AA39GAC3_SARSR|nr:hypothetical protein NLU13_9561 [Sarocladium strictum]